MSLVRLHVYTGTSELSLLAVAISTKNNVNFHLNNYQIQMVDKSACIRPFCCDTVYVSTVSTMLTVVALGPVTC